MTKSSIAIVFLFFVIFGISAQKTKEEFYKSLLGKDSLVDFVLKNRDKYRLQFIVTDIQRDLDGQEEFKTYDFTTNEYFYPASMVKLPTAVAMFEILDSLDISRDSYVKMNKDFNCGSSGFVDLTLKRNIPISLAIEDMLSISDNAYYSLFFNVVTPKLLNYKLTERQLYKTNIFGGFTGCPRGKLLETHSYSIFSPDGTLKVSYPKSILDSSEFMYRLPFTSRKLIGKYQMENG
ncbi:MAG: serine hydrolase, partial [Crocinitomicaceae bacterium]